MAGLTRTAGAFAVTPHKISVCILLQIYAPSAQMSLPFPFSSVAQHNRLGLYLLSLTKVSLFGFSRIAISCSFLRFNSAMSFDSSEFPGMSLIPDVVSSFFIAFLRASLLISEIDFSDVCCNDFTAQNSCNLCRFHE